MKKKILTILGIVILFLGVGIQPAIAVTPNTSGIENDCNLCPKKVSKPSLVLIQSLLDRLKYYDNELSVLTKFYFRIGVYKEISNRLIVLEEINIGGITYWDFPIICPLLFILQLSLIALEFYSWYFGFHFDLPLVNVMIEILDVLGSALHCSWYVHPP
jgi:hypothetical protein